MIDNFTSYSDGQLITSPTYYEFAQFPNAGQSKPTNPSSKWETDTGKFEAQRNLLTTKIWGFSGEPNEWPDRYFFRLNTRESAKDQVVSFDYMSAPFGEDGYPVEGSDATAIWLRFQSQYWLYVLQFDRVNNGMVVKRKVPALGWTGGSNLVSNKGVYYQLLTAPDQPIFGAGIHGLISWEGVRNILSAEDKAKPAYPNLAHDKRTTYHFEARIMTPAPNQVKIQLFRGGVLVGSWLDKNDCKNAAGRTFQQDWDAGYFNSVTGKIPEWGQPIQRTGKSGLRADNIKVWINNFSLTDASVPEPEPPTTPTVEARVEELEAQVEGLNRLVVDIGDVTGDLRFEVAQAKDRITTLETKLTKIRQALE